MTCTVVCILIIVLIVDVHGTHFLGGTITWRPLNQSATGTPIPIVITQTYSWVYSLITCTNAMIATSQLIGLGVYTNLATKTLDCIANCGNGSLGYVAPSIVPRCTDISAPIGTTVGQRSDTVYLEVGDDFSAAFQLVGWRPLTPYLASAPWSISTRIIVKARSDNGVYNSAPVATMMSPINIPVYIPTVIYIPVADADGDPIRCRWSVNGTAGADECGGICPPNSLPPSTIIYPNCTIVITGQNINDWFAVALMVEDFISISSTIALSSVPVQFLVHVVGPPNCTTPPKIVGKPTEQSCTPVMIGATFTSQLIAKNYCGNNVTIVDIATLSFPGMVKGNITAMDTSTYYIDLSWTPTASQLGYQVMCAIAFDSENSQSSQYCFKFYVSNMDECSCPGENCIITTTANMEQKPKPNNWPFIGTVIGLTLLLAVTLCSCVCCRYCSVIGGAGDRYNHNGPCEFYHIERCFDPDCPWQNMPSSSSILPGGLISGKNSVRFKNIHELPTSTISSVLSYSTNDDNYLIVAHSQNRNYLLTIDDHKQAKSSANMPMFNVKVTNALESEISSGVKSSIHRINEKALDSPLIKRNTNDNRKLSQMKSIAKETKPDIDNELSEQYMPLPCQKIKAKHPDNEAEYGIRVTHLHSQVPINTHQSLINRPQDNPIVKHVHLAQQKLTTNQHNVSQIETIELSALESTQKPLSVITSASDAPTSNVHIEHIHTKKKRSTKSKKLADPVESVIVVEKKQKNRKQTKHHETLAKDTITVEYLSRKNTTNQ